MKKYTNDEAYALLKDAALELNINDDVLNYTFKFATDNKANKINWTMVRCFARNNYNRTVYLRNNIGEILYLLNTLNSIFFINFDDDILNFISNNPKTYYYSKAGLIENYHNINNLIVYEVNNIFYYLVLNYKSDLLKSLVYTYFKNGKHIIKNQKFSCIVRNLEVFLGKEIESITDVTPDDIFNILNASWHIGCPNMPEFLGEVFVNLPYIKELNSMYDEFKQSSDLYKLFMLRTMPKILISFDTNRIITWDEIATRMSNYITKTEPHRGEFKISMLFFFWAYQNKRIQFDDALTSFFKHNEKIIENNGLLKFMHLLDYGHKEIRSLFIRTEKAFKGRFLVLNYKSEFLLNLMANFLDEYGKLSPHQLEFYFNFETAIGNVESIDDLSLERMKQVFKFFEKDPLQPTYLLHHTIKFFLKYSKDKRILDYKNCLAWQLFPNDFDEYEAYKLNNSNNLYIPASNKIFLIDTLKDVVEYGKIGSLKHKQLFDFTIPNKIIEKEFKEFFFTKSFRMGKNSTRIRWYASYKYFFSNFDSSKTFIERDDVIEFIDQDARQFFSLTKFFKFLVQKKIADKEILKIRVDLKKNDSVAPISNVLFKNLINDLASNPTYDNQLVFIYIYLVALAGDHRTTNILLTNVNDISYNDEFSSYFIKMNTKTDVDAREYPLSEPAYKAILYLYNLSAEYRKQMNEGYNQGFIFVRPGDHTKKVDIMQRYMIDNILEKNGYNIPKFTTSLRKSIAEIHDNICKFISRKTGESNIPLLDTSHTLATRSQHYAQKKIDPMRTPLADVTPTGDIILNSKDYVANVEAFQPCFVCNYFKCLNPEERKRVLNYILSVKENCEDEFLYSCFSSCYRKMLKEKENDNK